MKITTHKMVDVWTPELSEPEWDLLFHGFNTVGTSDTGRPCGYFGSKTRLAEIIQEAQQSEQLEPKEVPGLENLLKEVLVVDPETDSETSFLMIWNGR